jgi:hypothetical protein
MKIAKKINLIFYDRFKSHPLHEFSNRFKCLTVSIKIMAVVAELLNYGKLLDEGEKIILEEIKKAEGIDDTKRHLHVIDCLRTHGTETAHWSVVAAILSDGDSEDVGGWVRFINYKGCIERIDANKPLSEQMEVKKS